MKPATEAAAVARAARRVAHSPLAAMVGVSLLAHFLLAASISVEQPTATPRFPDDAQIALITSKNSDPEIVEWILSNDPANIFGPERGLPSAARMEYRPSFDASTPSIRLPDPAVAEIRIPNIRQPGEGVGVRRGSHPARSSGLPAVTIERMGSEQSRYWKGAAAIGSEELAAVRAGAIFMRGEEAGMPGPILLMVRSSGSERLDELGMAELRKPSAAGDVSGLYRLVIERSTSEEGGER